MSARALPANGAEKGRILLVEDNADVRRLIAFALELGGHDIVEAGSAEEGLLQLESGHFDLVISDFALPGQTGAWMLHQALAEGLLDDSATMMLTAHPHPERVEGVEIISKPLDLDDFLAHVSQRLSGLRRPSGAKRSDVSRASRDEGCANYGSRTASEERSSNMTQSMMAER
jgi:CheY-like chemotaxis protein